MRGILVIMLTFCFFAQPYCNVVLAENEDEMEYSWGVVKEVSNDRVVVTEYDYDTDVDIDVVYSVSSDAKVYNAETLDDISTGDTVEIDYFIVGGKKEVKAISVEAGEEEYEPLETYDEGYEFLSEEKESKEEQIEY